MSDSWKIPILKQLDADLDLLDEKKDMLAREESYLADMKRHEGGERTARAIEEWEEIVQTLKGDVRLLNLSIDRAQRMLGDGGPEDTMLEDMRKKPEGPDRSDL